MEAIGGHEHDAATDHVERVAGVHGSPVDDQLAVIGLAVAGEELEQRLLALTLEGGESEHFARMDGQADVVKLSAGAETASLEGGVLADDRGCRAHSRLVTNTRRRLAEHRRDDRCLTANSGHEGCDVATVAQHRAHVAVLAYLGEAVGDEQHGAVALAPPAHHGEDPLGEIWRERGGDLVEEQQLRVERQGSGEIEHAQEGQRHVTHLLAEVESVEVHVGEVPAHGVEICARQAEVLGHRQIGRHRRVLEHRGEAAAPCIAGALHGSRLAVDADRTSVSAQDAGEDLDERRLAGAVGAEQSVNLTGCHGQVDGAQGDDRPERLRNGSGLQQWNGHGRVVCVSQTTRCESSG